MEQHPITLWQTLANWGESLENRHVSRREFGSLCLKMAAGAIGASALFSCSQTQEFPRPPMVSFKPASQPLRARSDSQLLREIRMRRDILPKSNYERRRERPMKARYITIHSTANRRAGALQHAKALHNGAMRSLAWHFTCDQYLAVQHLPLNVTGRHADRGGPGDKYSIAIEMCEVEGRGQNHIRTWDRAAKLTAYLMKKYDIPLRNVVPHYFWTHKDCPAPLLENRRPGAKWAWFKSRIDYYYRCINNGRSNLG